MDQNAEKVITIENDIDKNNIMDDAMSNQKDSPDKDKNIDLTLIDDNKNLIEEVLNKSNFTIPSNFIGGKPNTIESNNLGQLNFNLTDLNASPLMSDNFSASQLLQLGQLSPSLFYSQHAENYFSFLGMQFMDSFIDTLKTGTGISYRDNFNSSNYSTSNFSQQFTSSKPVTNSLTLFGDNNNNLINGGAGNDVIYGNVVTATAPYSLLYTIDNPTPELNDNFGGYLVVSGDIALIGESGNDTGANAAGAAHIYDLATNTILHSFYNPTPSFFEGFGETLAVSDKYALIGVDDQNVGGQSAAGSAYVYNVETGALLYTFDNPTPDFADRFGLYNAISGDFAVITSFKDDNISPNAGSFYIYDLLTGNLLHSIINPTSESNDFFGTSIDASGNYALVGAAGDNTGAVSAGSAYIYNMTTGALLHTLNNPTPTTNDSFGRIVKIEGNYALIYSENDDTGVSRAGSLHVYELATGTLLHTLNNPTPQANDSFGYFSATFEDYILIGAHSDDTGAVNAGSAYIYDLSTGALLHTLNNPTPKSGDFFGRTLAVEGDYAVVGVGYDDTYGAYAGSVNIYDLISGDLLHTLYDPTPEANDFFGNSLDISGNKIFIGAGGNDDGGSFYVYQVDFGDADKLYGGAGDDTLYGLRGDDILYGEGGSDILYGGEGGDRFVFDTASAFDAQDTIADFNILDGDVIDISDLLTGYNKGVSDITNFVQFIDTGSDSVMQIDADGTINGVNFQAVALITNGAGLDPTILETSGQLDGIV